MPDCRVESFSLEMKQMYDYVAVDTDNTEQIYTPPDQEEKKNNVSLEQLQQQRQNEI